jgi:hypothetical protein
MHTEACRTLLVEFDRVIANSGLCFDCSRRRWAHARSCRMLLASDAVRGRSGVQGFNLSSFAGLETDVSIVTPHVQKSVLTEFVSIHPTNTHRLYFCFCVTVSMKKRIFPKRTFFFSSHIIFLTNSVYERRVNSLVFGCSLS